ncbi:TPA: BPSL0067 family protein [Citrobacter farmeri]|uniref:BPSL0067 family protein n=1 Tax=Citrobacter farmeri TaxID=67824 RepID=UPI00189D05DC|nr:BPSL0067 family protein [Citrobacter farmeri]MDZ7531579.1 BPSL0067 family protein [Citrobacter farmeri]GJL46409.1 hypothetical protein TUM17580_24680 [Citrobacter farmeri]HCD2002751.1 BPSL0067 family protein [Citrobacter farmeri]HEM7972853.1 BPSL0067 family protein [Citrobacter farmeri]HEM7973773.1 BPSL0067 family protein [Citrobacter farmeri]
MAYIAATPRTYIGESVGIGQCVAFTQRAAGMPVTRNWRRGVLVKGNMSIVPGTAIATFDDNQRHGNHSDGRSHTAIYLSQDANGIHVLDQWMNHSVDRNGTRIAIPHHVSQRTIFFRNAPRAEKITCPDSLNVKNEPHRLNDETLFQGLPEKQGDLMPDTDNAMVWTLKDYQDYARKSNLCLHLICRYEGTDQTVALRVPDTAKKWSAWFGDNKEQFYASCQ